MPQYVYLGVMRSRSKTVPLGDAFLFFLAALRERTKRRMRVTVPLGGAVGKSSLMIGSPNGIS